jgi:hypothetical protein
VFIIIGRRFVRIAEAWASGGEGQLPEVDLVRWFQRDAPMKGAFCRPYPTLVVDLTRPEGRLFSAMKPGTRYEIRRAEREGARWAWWDGRESGVIDRFAEVYQRFAERRGLPGLDRTRLELMARSGCLVVSAADPGERRPAVWHVYHRDLDRATLLHSASLSADSPDGALRGLHGRANRFQHWQDVRFFKARGDAIYDFGGWYSGSGDPRRLGINRFKEGFGGDLVTVYVCERPLTWRGRVFLAARRRLLGDKF